MQCLSIKRSMLIICLFSASGSLYSQNQWAFLKGYLNYNQATNNYYEAPNVSNTLNKPGSREHCGSGIFDKKIWIYGGEGNDSGSDLWYYDINHRNWFFVENKGYEAIHANLGNESLTAHPGHRSRMASAMDQKGNFYLFGGDTKDWGFHTGRNDLWRYNTNTNKWTWLGGSSSHSSAGSYKSGSEPDWPRARYRCRGWFDDDGNYWIFGGLYYDGVNTSYPLNDMWKYNVEVNKWTCETGDCNTLHQPNTPSGVYPDNVGETSTAFSPRARADFGYWLDKDANFWLFAGFNGEVHSGGQLLWDTWMYNTKTHEWTLKTLEGAPSITSPGWQGEPMCWLGNDGLPWMKLVNRSIWKFNNNRWENQRFEEADTWAPPILVNNEPFVANSENQPGSHYTTFNHIKTDSAVFLFNGYGLGFDNHPNFTGALWQYNLEIPQPPNLAFSISKDDFVPNGASPYTSSKREILIQNAGNATANNVEVTIGLSPENNYSAMILDSIVVLDDNNIPLTGIKISSVPFVNPEALNSTACGYDTATYKSTIKVLIPKIRIGEAVKIKALVEHCMANFELPTNYHSTWNNWGYSATFKDDLKREYSKSPVYNSASNTLEAYSWREYKAALPSLNSSSSSQVFSFELGSGVYGDPTNEQDLGVDFANAQARLDLRLPQNIFLENGNLTDIIGEYAKVSGTSVELVNVQASSIDYGLTNVNNEQSYIIRFPGGRYLPIRRIFVKLRTNSPTADVAHITGGIRTTFNYHYANFDYGWKPASK
jgi:hypothetical protein